MTRSHTSTKRWDKDFKSASFVTNDLVRLTTNDTNEGLGINQKDEPRHFYGDKISHFMNVLSK